MIVKRTQRGAPIVFLAKLAVQASGPNHLGDMLAAYRAGEMRQACEAFARLIQGVEKDERAGNDAATRAEWARAVSAALGVFVQPDFLVPDEMVGPFVAANPLLANIMAGVGTTTDPFIRMVEGQTQAGFKSAVLCTARNAIGMNLDAMLADNPMLASAWLNKAVQVMYAGNADKQVSASMRWILANVDDRLEPAAELQELYFLVSYLGDLDMEKRVKGAINKAIQRHLDRTLTNRPNPRKIAVWAEYWNEGHSVYRTLKGFIEALRPHFDEITLIHCVKPTEELDVAGFDRVIRLEHDGFRINPTPLDGNEWGAMVFADVGMTLPSILISNMRIAPVQILLTGHPVSTFGGQMDWFVSGALVDTNESNYSERLAILPHFGAIHEPVAWRPTGRRHGRDEIVVNVSAYGQKVHHEFLEAINEAFGKASKPVRLQLFSGLAPTKAKGLGAFADAVAAALPNAHVELIMHLPYEDYMARIEQADFGIDSWPFGGSNVISDQIAAGVPVLCMAGDRWFNSIGPAMMRAVGFTVAENRQAFDSMLTGLVTKEDLRSGWRDWMIKRSLKPVYDRSDAAIFGQFVADLASDPGYYPGSQPVWLGGLR